MKKLILILIWIANLVLLQADTVSADVLVAGESAVLASSFKPVDYRVTKLKQFLSYYNSPLTDYADYFVYYADKYQVDWRLVPSISGVESTFGKQIPSNSYNAYGWANGKYSFRSWAESIEVVNRTLREKYINKGADSIYEISRIYAPPSQTWAFKVKYFMNKLDSLPLEYTI